MNTSGSTPGISCTRCRQRKIRCSRSLPSCDQCDLVNVECSYPERQARKPRRKVLAHTLTESGALDGILERLQRVEAQTSTRSLSPGSYAPQTLEAEYPVIVEGSPGSSSVPRTCQSCGSHRPTGSPTSAGTKTLAPSPLQSSGTEAESASSSTGPFDATSILSLAVDRVQQLKKTRNYGARALTTECITIPPDSARRWIDNYFSFMSGKIYPALVDRKMIDLMPDLIGMSHVHVDACMLLVYYCILWQGCFFHETSSYRSPDKRYARQLFICCLRAIPIWQSEAIGTVSDFIAAMFMTQTATENLDFSLSWEMHKLACEYAEGLRMHSLDTEGNFGVSKNQMCDQDRIGMWDLIQLDLFFRLINNKPAAFSSSLNEWRVNLPSLSFHTSPDQDKAVPSMAFLARSRITFILMTYFQRLEGLQSDSDALELIEPLCEEVEKAFEQWRIDEWLQSYKRDDVNAWILGVLALSGYTCILFMLRKVTLPGSNEDRPLLSDNDDMIPRSNLSMRAARRILEIVYHILHIVELPGPEALSLALGPYRAYVAFAHLAGGLIQAPSAATVGEDLQRLRRVAQCVETIATTKEQEFLPLARDLKFVSNEVERRVLGDRA